MTYKRKYYQRRRYYRTRGKTRLLSGEEFFVIIILVGVGLLFYFAPKWELFLLGWSVVGILGIIFFFFLLRFFLQNQFLKKIRDIEEVRDKLTPRQFEIWMGYLLKKLGYKRVRVVGGVNRGDGGVDVRAYSPEGKFTLVQCKKYSGYVGVSEVRDFIGAMVDFKADRGIFVTTGYYSKDSKALGKRIENLELWDRKELAKLM